MSLEVVLGGFAISFFKLIVGLVLSIGSIYLGIRLFDRLTPGIDEIKEIKKGNFSVGVLLAGIVLSIAVIVESGVKFALVSIVPSLSFPAMLVLLFVAVIKLLIALLVAVFAVYIALRVMDNITPDIDEIAELKKGNIAIAVVMAVIMLSVSFVIKSATDSFMEVVDLSLIMQFFGLG